MSTPPDAPVSASDAAESSPWLRWAPLLVVLFAWVAHWSVTDGGWLLDDARLLRDDPVIARGPEAIPDLLAEDWFPSAAVSGTYGPLVRASFALEAPLHARPDAALSPKGFHLTNLLLHGLCALLLCRVLLGLMPQRPILGLAAALCFAVHPIHAGTIGALMGRAELLAAFFSLLTVLCWRAYGGRRWIWLPAVALAWLAAILSKEIALGVPLALFVLDRALPPDGRRRPLFVPGTLGYFVFAVPLGVFAATWGGPGASLADLPAQGLGARLILGFEALGRMLLHLVIPVGFRGDHSDEAMPGSGFPLDGAAVTIAAVLILLSLFVLWRALRGRAGVLDTVWLLVVALAVPAVLAAPAGAPFEHRFAYVITLPLFAAAGALLESLTLRAGRADTFRLLRGALAGSLALICLVGLSHREAAAWRDDESFHDRLLERNPQHVRAMVRLARHKRLIAQDLRLRAALLPANDPVRQEMLDRRSENLRVARAWSARAVRHELGRRSAAAWRELGLARLASDESADALTALERAQELDPIYLDPSVVTDGDAGSAQVRHKAEVHNAIGRCRAALGRRESAADAFLTAHRLDPERLDYAERAGSALCRVNRYAEGIELLWRTLRRTRDPVARERIQKAISDARVSAQRIGTRFRRDGEKAQGKGQWKAAVRLYEQAIAVNPKEIEAFIHSGWLRGWWFGNYDLGFRRLDQAEKLLDERGTPKDDRRRRMIAGYRKKLQKQMEEEDGDDDDDGG